MNHLRKLGSSLNPQLDELLLILFYCNIVLRARLAKENGVASKLQKPLPATAGRLSGAFDISRPTSRTTLRITGLSRCRVALVASI
ncbi:MAG TPA: hypothetical protein DCK93_19955 [Blastocatellia bacterium]|jgi:hypothetical protein|nr:hypothetical protein [Blastocatellia bacterium]